MLRFPSPVCWSNDCCATSLPPRRESDDEESRRIVAVEDRAEPIVRQARFEDREEEAARVHVR